MYKLNYINDIRNFTNSQKEKNMIIKKTFPRQNKLASILRLHEITYDELSKAIKLSPATISCIINGSQDYKVSIARKIILYIKIKHKTEYTLDQIAE